MKTFALSNQTALEKFEPLSGSMSQSQLATRSCCCLGSCGIRWSSPSAKSPKVVPGGVPENATTVADWDLGGVFKRVEFAEVMTDCVYWCDVVELDGGVGMRCPDDPRIVELPSSSSLSGCCCVKLVTPTGECWG